jgi:hypothetical protein
MERNAIWHGRENVPKVKRGIARRIIALGAPVLASLCIVGASARADEGLDQFGIKELFPTRAAGREWFAHWKGSVRDFTGVDPEDKWFDADHGNGHYTVDGHGKLTATGPTVRMYVHDPGRTTEWTENLEITVYFTRISETKLVPYSGPQIFARTNHGTMGDENRNLCDDRGYGAKITVDGRWEFEKETAHHLSNGYISAGTVNPWPELPRNVKVGVKFVIRNLRKDTQVKLELYRDLAGGARGGQWEKLTEFVDTGTNWGVGAGAAAATVKPELPLIRSFVLPGSETKKPMMSVYLRHEYGTVQYENWSIREIEPLP